MSFLASSNTSQAQPAQANSNSFAPLLQLLMRARQQGGSNTGGKGLGQTQRQNLWMNDAIGSTGQGVTSGMSQRMPLNPAAQQGLFQMPAYQPTYQTQAPGQQAPVYPAPQTYLPPERNYIAPTPAPAPAVDPLAGSVPDYAAGPWVKKNGVVTFDPSRQVDYTGSGA